METRTRTRAAVVGALVLSVTMVVSIALVRCTGSDRTPGGPSPSASLLPTARGEWRLAYRAEYGELHEDRRAIVATAPDDVWYVDDEAVHYDGARWRRMRPRYGGYDLNATGQVAASDREVWLVAGWENPDAETEDDEFLHPCVDYKAWALRWDGSRWIGRRLPCHATDLIVSDDGAMWVSVRPEDRRGGSVWYRWNGTGWSRHSRLSKRMDWIRAVDAPARDNVWVFGERIGSGQRDDPFVAHWDGTAWRGVSPPPVKQSVRRIASQAGASITEPIEHHVSDVLAVSENEVWVVARAYWRDGEYDPHGEGLLYRYDGARWHEETVPNPDNSPLRVTGVGEGQDGQIWCTVNRPWTVRRVGRDWQPTPPVPDAKKRRTFGSTEVAGTTVGGVVVTGETTWVVADTLRDSGFHRTTSIYRTG